MFVLTCFILFPILISPHFSYCDISSTLVATSTSISLDSTLSPQNSTNITAIVSTSNVTSSIDESTQLATATTEIEVPSSNPLVIPAYSPRFAGKSAVNQNLLVNSSEQGDSVDADVMIPFILFVVGIILGACLLASVIIRRARIIREVAKHSTKQSASKTQDPQFHQSATFTSANGSLIGNHTIGSQFENTKTSMSGKPIGNNDSPSQTTSYIRGAKTSTATAKFDINFAGAGIGYGNAQTPIPRANQESDEGQQPGGDTLVEYGPILSLPGFLQMEFSSDIRLKGKMAEGGGGVIYKADLLNMDFVARFGKGQVVVKVLKPLPNMAFTELKTIVFQEIAIMNSLSDHPNIIQLIGFTEEPLSIITKLYDRNLFSLVMAQPHYSRKSAEYEAMKGFIKQDTKLGRGLIVKGFEMLPEIAVHLAFGIASGMNEMHRFGILHRDLKSANVLLEFKPLEGGSKPGWMEDPALSSLAERISGLFNQSSLAGGVGWGKDAYGKPYCPVNPIVCDFGLAKMIKKPDGPVGYGQSSNTPAVSGMKEAQAVGISYRYAAPEAFNRMYNKGASSDEGKPVDVYAFAIMVWEMLERKVPFHKMSNKEVETRVKAGERPLISPQFKDFNRPPSGNKHYPLLVKIVESCWKQDPRRRPSFEECKQKLRAFWLGSKEIRDS